MKEHCFNSLGNLGWARVLLRLVAKMFFYGSTLRMDHILKAQAPKTRFTSKKPKIAHQKLQEAASGKRHAPPKFGAT